MSDPFIGMICIFGFNFPPYGWATCSGQQLSIMQYPSLYALLGTTYGGNGQSTFALPDMQGRGPVGRDAVISPLGTLEGQPTTTLITNNMPAHNHLINAFSGAGDVEAPAGAFRAHTGSLDKEYKKTATGGTTVQMHASMVGFVGSNVALSIMQPSLAVNYSIALEGIFPSFQ